MRFSIPAACVVWSLFTATLVADEVRYYEQDGVTYRETRTVIRRPVTETRYEPREQTVYREQYSTTMQDSVRTVQVPVTEHRWEAEWKGRWNPFVKPYMIQRLVPRTTIQTRTEVVKVPVSRRDLVPETRTTHVPQTSMRMVEEEIIHRVAVNAPATGTQFTGAALAALPPPPNRVGGVAQLDNDPPRRGVDSGWRPSTDTGTIRR